MAEKAAGLGTGFRPHFKTHRSREIGAVFRRFTGAITVSSPGMGLYFARDGFSRITLAFPVNILQSDELRELALAADTGFLVSSPGAVDNLGRALKGASGGVWVKVDCGFRRAGIRWSDREGLVSTRERLESHSNLAFRGILTHAGDTYSAGDREGVLRVHRASLERMALARDSMGGGCLVSVGDTPSCSVADSFPGVDEIRPGNFVFNDATQMELGSCSPSDIAFAVLCPVVEVHRDRTVILGGAVHLSRDTCPSRFFGYAGEPSGDGFFNPVVSHPVIALSQEHGVIRGVPPGASPGTMLPVIPAHSCLAADCLPCYTDENGEVLDKYR